MKKTFLITTIVGVAVLTLGIAGFAFAQSQPSQPFPGSGHGPGMMGDSYGYGRGGMMGNGYSHGGMMGGQFEMGALHDDMVPAIAAALGLTPKEFEARHEAGETFWDIAEAQGLTSEEAWDLMVNARSEALQQAVADGVITQEFADWMLDHMDTMHGEGFGSGSHCGEGTYGPRGSGF